MRAKDRCSELSSMTGFGRGEAMYDGIMVSVEASSVNRRQFELRVNLPRSLASLESKICEQVKKYVVRGSVLISVKIQMNSNSSSLIVDEELALSFFRRITQLAKKTNLNHGLTALSLITLPGVLKDNSQIEDSSKLWKTLNHACSIALESMIHMKRKEGKALGNDIIKRMNSLRCINNSLKKLSSNYAANCRSKLIKKLAKSNIEVSPKDPSFVKEVAMIVDKCDISEEIVRLQSHMDQMEDLICKGGAVGRTLDFICQEMFREINTIGSKSEDIRISRNVVEFKSTLETIREQVQNLE